MKIDHTIQDGVSVIAITGEIDGLSAPELETQLGQITENGATNIVLDLSEVPYISSAGLRVIISTAKFLRGNGTMVLASLRNEVQEILSMVGFDTILGIFDDVPTAVQSINAEVSSSA